MTEPTDAMTADEIATLESQRRRAKDPEFMADLRRRATRLDAIYDKQRVELRLPADVVAAAKLAAHHRFLSLNAWAEEAFAEKLAAVAKGEDPADATFVQEIRTILAENAKIVQLLADQ